MSHVVNSGPTGPISTPPLSSITLLKTQLRELISRGDKEEALKMLEVYLMEHRWYKRLEDFNILRTMKASLHLELDDLEQCRAELDRVGASLPEEVEDQRHYLYYLARSEYCRSITDNLPNRRRAFDWFGRALYLKECRDERVVTQLPWALNVGYVLLKNDPYLDSKYALTLLEAARVSLEGLVEDYATHEGALRFLTLQLIQAFCYKRIGKFSDMESIVERYRKIITEGKGAFQPQDKILRILERIDAP